MFININKHKFFKIDGIFINVSLFTREKDFPQVDIVQFLNVIKLMSTIVIC